MHTIKGMAGAVLNGVKFFVSPCSVFCPRFRNRSGNFADRTVAASNDPSIGGPRSPSDANVCQSSVGKRSVVVASGGDALVAKAEESIAPLASPADLNEMPPGRRKRKSGAKVGRRAGRRTSKGKRKLAKKQKSAFVGVSGPSFTGKVSGGK
jgi:hypothetical protein